VYFPLVCWIILVYLHFSSSFSLFIHFSSSFSLFIHFSSFS
jgi:hypothetical protein